MTRRIRNRLAMVDSMVLLGFSLLWIRGFLVQDKLHFTVFGRLCIVGSHPHHLHVLIDGQVLPSSDRIWMSHSSPIPARLEHLEPGIQLGRRWDIWLPHWLPMLLIGSPLIWRSIQYRLHHKQPSGLCPHCGYDLRATPDRCPECGREADRPIQVERS